MAERRGSGILSGRVTASAQGDQRKRLRALASAVAVAIPAGMTLAAANSPDTFTASTALNTAANWSTQAVPGPGFDAVFSSSSPSSGLTLNATTLNPGSIDDVHTGVATTITNATTTTTASMITLGGSGGTDSVSGSNGADLIYVASLASTVLNLNGGSTGALNFVLGQAGAIDVGASSTVNIGTSGAASTFATGGFGLTTSGAGAINIGEQITGTGSLTVNSTGATTLSANNSYSGTTTIGTSASLQITAAATETYGSTGAVSNSGTLFLAPSSTFTLTYGANITGGNLNQFGAGITTLSGTNTISGTTTITAGTLNVGPNTTLSGPLVLNGSGTLDLGAHSQSLTGLTGGTTTTAYTSVLKNGTLNLTSFAFAPDNIAAASTSLLDLSRLSSFTYSQASSGQSFNIQVGSGTGVTTTSNTSVTLSTTSNSITVTSLNVGPGTNSSGGVGTLTLGTTNTIDAGTIQLGGYRSSGGDILFAGSLTNPTITLRGVAGTSTAAVNALTVGLPQSGGLGNTSTFDTTAGSIDGIVNQLNIAIQGTGTPGGANTTGAFRFTTGKLNAGTIDIGGTNQTAATTSVTLNGSLTQNAGALLADYVIFGNNADGLYPSTSVVGVAQANITYASAYNLGTSSTSATLSAGTLTLNTLTSNASSRFTFNFNNGIITNYDNSVNGFSGEGNADGTSNNVTNLVIQGQSGGGTAVDAKTLNIVLASTGTHALAPETSHSITESATALISGSGGLTFNGPGTVILNGANTYTGGNNATAGTVNANTNTALGSAASTVGLSLTPGSSTAAVNFTSAAPTIASLASSGAGASSVVLGNSTNSTSTALTIGNSSNLSANYLGSISDAGASALGSVIKAGSGVQTFSGVNTYSAGTTVNAGSLRAGSSTAIPTGTALTLNAGTVDLNAQYPVTGGTVTGGVTLSTLTANGGGIAFVLNGNASDQIDVTGAAGGTGGGSLTISGGSAITPGNYTLISSTGTGSLPTFTLANTGFTAAGGGGSYTLSLATSGTADVLTVFSATPTLLYFTGASSALYSDAGNYAINSAGTSAANTAPTAGSDVIFTANNATTTNVTVTGPQAADSLTFTGTGTPAGTTPVVLSGSGVLTIAATGVNVSAGTGIVVQSGAAADTISANLALGAAQSWTNSATSVFTVSGQLDTAGNGLTIAGTGPQTISGNIIGAGSLTQSDSGLVVLSGSNTFSGTTTLTAGTTALNSVNAVGSGTVIAAGGAIDNTSGGSIALANANAIVLNNDLTFVGSNGLNLGTGNVSLGTSAGAARTISVTANTLEIDGTIANGTNGTTPTIALIKTGVGSLTLGGSNSYTGQTTLSAGQLNLNNANAIGTGTLALTAGTLNNTSGGAITLATNNAVSLGGFTFGGSNPLNVGTGAASFNTGAAVTVNVNGTSPLTFGGTLSTSTASNTAGTLSIVTAGNLTLTGGSLATPSVLGTPISVTGAGSLNISGYLNTTNKTSFDGGITVNSTETGTLETAASDYVGLGNATLNVTGGVLGINPGTGNSLFISNGSGTGLLNINGGTVNLVSATRLFVGDFFNGSPTAVSAGSGGNGILTVANGTFSTGTGNNVFVIGPVNASVSGVSTANPGTGVVNLNAGGVLATLRPITYGGSTSPSASGIFNFNGGTLLATGSTLTMSGLTAANVGTFGANIDTSTFGVTIAQSLLHNTSVVGADGGLSKYSVGTLTLTGASTFTGPTTIAAGVLAVDSSGTGTGTASLSGTSGVTIAVSATLHLISVAASATTNLVNDAANVNVRTTSGTTPTGAITLDLAGAVETVNSFQIDGVYQPAGVYGSATFLGSYTGSNKSSAALADDGFFSGNGGLNAAVPEPSTLSLLGIGAFGLLSRRRRRLVK